VPLENYKNIQTCRRHNYDQGQEQDQGGALTLMLLVKDDQGEQSLSEKKENPFIENLNPFKGQINAQSKKDSQNQKNKKNENLQSNM